jgi:AcrR family transcriptional regulator
MSSKERHEREREAMHRAILDAARELFVHEGYRNVSIRKIAERIEYSPGAIYSYFPGKDDIFFALAEEGFRLLSESLAHVAEGVDDPLEVLRHGFWHYYEFSKLHPEYYELMFVDRTVPQISDEWERFGFVAELLQRASASIRRCVERGIFPPETVPDTAFHVLWTAVHGVAVVRLCNRMGPGEDADSLAHDTIETVLAGMRAGVKATFRPSADCCPAAAAVPGNHGVIDEQS